MADAKQDVNNGPSQSNRVVLAKPRLGGFGSSNFGASNSIKSNPLGSVLRPPQLKPGNNPFLKVAGEKEKSISEDASTEESAEDRLKDNAEAPKFMPLGTSNVTPRTANPVPTPAQPAASSSSFVFGQNLSERVVMKENVNNGDADTDHSSTNGTSELLFTSAVASTAKEGTQDEAGSSVADSAEGLAAAAAEYERSHARPPPPTSNCTMTGEEGETNVLQISCRLFAWEAGSWRERGRGVLRLNDTSDGARVVARVAGSLRVVLNTKLWPEMVVERASTKSLRITATDVQQQVKLFLIMGAPGDIAQLHRALSTRVAQSRAPDLPSTPAPRLPSPPADPADPADPSSLTHDSSSPTPDLDTDTAAGNSDPELQHDNVKQLKRKEPADDETSPKRQCPKILVE